MLRAALDVYRVASGAATVVGYQVELLSRRGRGVLGVDVGRFGGDLRDIGKVKEAEKVTEAGKNEKEQSGDGEAHIEANAENIVSARSEELPVESTHTTEIPKQVTTEETVHAVNNAEEKVVSEDSSQKSRVAKAASVPESSLSRAFGFGSLGVRLAAGAASEATRRFFQGENDSTSKRTVLFTEQNANRIASSLSRMRGAALKLGQMISIQDQDLLPKELVNALETVRQNADYMPTEQLDKVLSKELGSDWRLKFESFDETPIAAASIGQVHRAKTLDGVEVAVKVQYPGVVNSIDSDLNNLRRLITYSGAMPKSYYLDEAMEYARYELSKECNYVAEAESQNHFRQLIMHDDRFMVPRALTELSTERILTSEWVNGKAIDTFDAKAGYSQEFRDRLGSLLMELTLKELFTLRYMQTDPNFSNFFYDGKRLCLLDFGAARDYEKDFVDNYLQLVLACANQDRDAIIHYSQELGFLTGDESKLMLDAHVGASFVVGEPFQSDVPYDFQSANIAGRTASFGHTLAKHRLTPPPKEAYSLHRRLSGAFLLCVRLQAKVSGRQMLMDVYNNYPSEEKMNKDLAEASS